MFVFAYNFHLSLIFAGKARTRLSGAPFIILLMGRLLALLSNILLGCKWQALKHSSLFRNGMIMTVKILIVQAPWDYVKASLKEWHYLLQKILSLCMLVSALHTQRLEIHQLHRCIFNTIKYTNSRYFTHIMIIMTIEKVTLQVWMAL